MSIKLESLCNLAREAAHHAEEAITAIEADEGDHVWKSACREQLEKAAENLLNIALSISRER